jgi:hypothetical protein
MDVDLARGWQIGIVADGLVQTDRPEGGVCQSRISRRQIQSAISASTDMDGPTLIAEMFRRAPDLGISARPVRLPYGAFADTEARIARGL